MESIPGVVIAAEVVQDLLGVDGYTARGISAIVIVITTLIAVALLSLIVLDDSQPSSGKSGGGSASGSVEETPETGASTVVLAGPALSGKTALFHRLCTGNLPKTVTSLESASASATIRAFVDDAEGAVDVRIVDMPGHPRAAGRDRLHSLLRSSATKLAVIVVDASTKASIRGGAGMLAQLLTSASFVDSNTRVAIVGTRGDVAGSTDAEGVQRMVEAELDNIRRSESALAGADAAAEVDGEAKSDKLALGGMTGEPFSLKRDSPLSSTIRFAVISNTDEAGPLAGQKAVKSAIVSALKGTWD
jgi:signal recognition particle receptor subunit beta